MKKITPFRTQNESQLKVHIQHKENEQQRNSEWSQTNDSGNRDEESIWIQRYKYENNLISNIIKENNYNKILELGSGPGKLSQLIQSDNETIKYDLVDNENAKNLFINRKYAGNFFIKNLMNGFDVSDLDKDYDLVIANDFLEHIANPSKIIYECRNITKENSKIFISVPNWRMGHTFIYRGLFDYDNFIYFMFSHGYNIESVSPSTLQCKYFPKLDSEKTMDNSLIQSWNWYFTFTKTN